jgi:hypothetical protein
MDDLMKEAWDLTNGDRRTAYGDPREVFDAYGAVWTSILGPKLKPGCTIDAADATLMMAGLKLCREAHKIKRDNVVDCHGYLSLHSKVTGLLEPPTGLHLHPHKRDCAHCVAQKEKR